MTAANMSKYGTVLVSLRTAGSPLDQWRTFKAGPTALELFQTGQTALTLADAASHRLTEAGI